MSRTLIDPNKIVTDCKSDRRKNSIAAHYDGTANVSRVREKKNSPVDRLIIHKNMVWSVISYSILMAHLKPEIGGSSQF